ncbi:MAG: hypothetical protein ACI9MB_003064 [Verrucomicrobiales bacterium]
MQKNLIGLFLLSISLVSANGQDPEVPTVPHVEPKTLIAIRALQSPIDAITTDRSAKQQELKNSPTLTEKETIAAKVQTLDSKIASLTSELKPIATGIATFFRTRGKNILITIAAMAIALFSLRYLHRSIDRFRPFRKRGNSFAGRLIDVVFYAVTKLLTVSVGLAALYALGDWMLLGFSLILLAGFLWASKTAILQLGDQVKLMLNLGSVREGERLVFDGIPWEVKRIGVYTRLTNPALEGGELRLPLRDLIPLSSRPFENKEPYFCCESGDWVILADGTYGKVIRQTPEWVQLVLLGSTFKTFSTSDFIGQNPENISRGFRINQTFGVDYAHQGIVTVESPNILQKKLTADLNDLVGEANVINVRAEFSNAGASSLDIALLADISGTAAEKFNQVTRAIQRSCVKSCNEHGWIIPFTQIKLHQAAANQSEPLAS